MASAMGATLHIHYCMNELVGSSFIQHEEHKCGKCGMTKKQQGGCCKDEHKTIKTGDHQLSKVSFAVNNVTAVLPSQVFYASKYYTPGYSHLKVTPRPHAPPDIGHNCPIYIRVRNFRI
jgi:hypothetical protein